MGSFWEVLMQTFLAFAFLLLITRIIGKQQISQLTFYDYVSGITLGSIAAVLATDIGQGGTWRHLLSLVLFGIFVFASSFITERSRAVRKVLEGEPTIVIHNGKILEGNMARMRYNLDNLTSQLRQKNVFNIGDVEYAILEPNGQLSVLLKSSKQPATREELNIQPQYQGISSELIVDGQIIKQNLTQNNLNQQWLMDELKKQGVYSVGEVEYAELNTAGGLYIDKKQDSLGHVIDMTDKEK